MPKLTSGFMYKSFAMYIIPVDWIKSEKGKMVKINCVWKEGIA